jgi:hypothetical protein
MDATAQAEAENAFRKATRPWFKKKRYILPLAFIVLVVMIQAANGAGDTGTSHTATSDSQLGVTSALGAQAMAVGIGSKVRDGTFDFVVTGVEHPGKTLAGKAGETLTAQGEFVVVRVNVTNIGKEARHLGFSCQLLSNDEGQKFEPSPAILSTKDALKYVEWINPGDTVKGAVMLFDVAPGTEVATIELHDSPFSPGVKVKLLGRSG